MWSPGICQGVVYCSYVNALVSISYIEINVYIYIYIYITKIVNKHGRIGDFDFQLNNVVFYSILV